MAVGEERHVARRLAQLGNQRVDAGADVGRGLAPRAAVAPEDPIRTFFADLLRGQALVLAVVPLQQGVAALGAVSEPGQLAGVEGARERTADHAGEFAALEPVPQLARLLAAVIGQLDVSSARVPHRPAPLGLAVAGEPNLRAIRH